MPELEVEISIETVKEEWKEHFIDEKPRWNKKQ